MVSDETECTRKCILQHLPQCRLCINGENVHLYVPYIHTSHSYGHMKTPTSLKDSEIMCILHMYTEYHACVNKLHTCLLNSSQVRVETEVDIIHLDRNLILNRLFAVPEATTEKRYN